MRDTVYTLSEFADEGAVADSIERMVRAVQEYVPGYGSSSTCSSTASRARGRSTSLASGRA